MPAIEKPIEKVKADGCKTYGRKKGSDSANPE